MFEICVNSTSVFKDLIEIIRGTLLQKIITYSSSRFLVK